MREPVIYTGNHVLMLPVDLSVLPNWHSLIGSGWVSKQEPHVTFQFIGKNLNEEQVREVIRDTFFTFRNIEPFKLTFTGVSKVFRNKTASFVLLVEPTDALVEMRNNFRNHCALSGLSIKDSYAFNPHMTIAEHHDRGAFVDDRFLAPRDAWQRTVNRLELKYGDGNKMTVSLK